MSLRMNKFIGSLGVVDAANNDLVSAATGINIYVLRAGANAYAASTISTSVPALTDSKGALAVNDVVKVLKSDGTLSTESFTIGGITETRTAATDTVTYSIAFGSVSGGTSTSLGQGERLVLSPHTLAGNQQSIYNSATEAAGSLISQPLQSDNEGNYEFYCNTDSVDLYFSGTGISDGYWVTDLKIVPKHEREHHLKRQTEASAATITLQPDTGILEISNTGTNLTTIEGAMPGRVLLVTGVGATAVNVNTATAVTADQVVVASTAPDPIVVPATGVLALVGAVSGGTNYWKAQRISGVSLAELNNISLSSLVSGQPLVWNGSNWVNSTTIGTTSDPITEMLIVSLKVQDGTGDIATLTFSGSANRAIVLPDAAGTLLIDAGTHTVTGEITFDDDALIVRDPSATTKKARLDCASVTAGNTRVLTVPDKDITIADAADVMEFTDIGADATTDGWPVVYRHATTDHRIDDDLASFDYPMATIYTQGVSIVKPGVGSFKVDIAPPLAASGNLSYRLPGNASGGSLLATTPTGQVVTGDIAFDDDGLLIHDPADTTKQARFDAGAITAGNTRVVSLADRNMDLAKQAQGRAITVNFELQNTAGSDGLNLKTLLGAVNGILLLRPVVNIKLKRVVMDFLVSSTLGTPAGQLQLYNAATLPSAATVPPTGTAMLSSAANIASLGAGRGTLINTTSFASDTVAAGNYLFLAASATVTAGTTSGSLFTLTIEYEANE